MIYTLPKLDFEYNNLEPYMDKETVITHYTKHHQTYTDKLNTALKNLEVSDFEITTLLSNTNLIPENIRTTVINNGGGYINHNFFWKILGKNNKNKLEPEGKLKSDIKKTFGSFEEFKEKFSEAALNHFGSGWAWLIIDLKEKNKLRIITTSNQISPISENMIPILTIDIWEHAYYLKYKNKRVDFISAFWNIINWTKVEEIYENATS
ncbi:MAG TPA: superoxide dismutase [Candidatus Paceibacterota bacterium]|nr:superoxide dismutase [Candidatus Paceibacterota bacterium]